MKDQITLEVLLSEKEKDLEKRLGELSFEGGLKLLEELVTRVESGTLPLEQAILSYERGVSLVAKLRGLLAGAEEKLKVLNKSA